MKKTYWKGGGEAGGELSCFFYLYRFRKYVPYGFPVIIFLIPEYIMKRPVYVVNEIRVEKI